VTCSFRLKYSGGISLIEMLIVVLVLGILASFSPLFLQGIVQKNQIHVVADEIKIALQFAKIEALAKAQSIALTPLPGHTDWSDGMALCIDNKQHQCFSGTELIREWHWYHKGLQVNWSGFESSHYLRFTPDLMERTANGYFTVMDQSQKPVKLVVNRLGRCRLVD